jgi:hypothetical protein
MRAASMATTVGEIILGIEFTDGIEVLVVSSNRCRLNPPVTKIWR